MIWRPGGFLLELESSLINQDLGCFAKRGGGWISETLEAAKKKKIQKYPSQLAPFWQRWKAVGIFLCPKMKEAQWQGKNFQMYISLLSWCILGEQYKCLLNTEVKYVVLTSPTYPFTSGTFPTSALLVPLS